MDPSSVSKPQYYGKEGEQHLYVIKLKRAFYPINYPSHSGVWIGVTIANKSRVNSKKEVEHIYQTLSSLEIVDIQSFSEHLNRLGLVMNSVD